MKCSGEPFETQLVGKETMLFMLKSANDSKRFCGKMLFSETMRTEVAL
jgi:hypothetical protein